MKITKHKNSTKSETCQPIVIASSNPGKIKDYQRLFLPLSIEIIPQTTLKVPDVEETGLTFVENALLKARNAAQHTGFGAIGDDSGLIVDALKGAPGLYSARYAGKGATDEENIQKLLTDLSDIPENQRRARFYAVIVFLRHAEDPAPVICEGSWEGEIAFTPKGSNGFGYLPIFYLPNQKISAALLSDEERCRISHRAMACQKLIEFFKTY